MSAYASYIVETSSRSLPCVPSLSSSFTGREDWNGASGGIELVGRLPLDARRSIVLVRVGAHVFLVGVGDNGFTKLGELAASDVPTAAPAEPGGFAQILARTMAKRDAAGNKTEEA